MYCICMVDRLETVWFTSNKIFVICYFYFLLYFRMTGTFNKYFKRNNVKGIFRLFVVRNWLWLPVTLLYHLHLNVLVKYEYM